ncbi:lamin tail domain-containing protein [Lewinella sp. JB7]|uniref:lamin tail domain-containing protein n=1 Tax=Lewinella sp. JB7 TaxID=2962887 RepID=UPI0020C9DB74|nr:lamin tail domain-containing protein [Lewinella sp. JB7]MCP9235133.1 lamin tail domain-containing protein [Lewinella sp. JB7]
MFWPFLTSPLATQSLRLSEIMVDPTPSRGLPAAEYVELYNAGDTAVDLTGLQIASGGKPVTVTGVPWLAAGEYALIVDERDADHFSAYGAPLLLCRLPSLTNGGDEVTVLLRGVSVAHLRYSPDWYHDEERDGGGYSLEFTGRGDPACGGNWRASLAESGGTPGRANSVEGLPADNRAPMVTETTLETGGVTISFDEAVTGIADYLFLLDDLPAAAERLDERTFHIPFSFVPGKVYRLTILPDYSDCAGNTPDQLVSRSLLLGSDLRPGDIVINELLFDPLPGESDFIELFNTSDHAFDLRGWQLLNQTSAQRPKVVNTSFVLLPGEFVVMTADRESLLRQHPNARRDRIVEMSLPSLPNAGANVTILTQNSVAVDALTYSPEMHAPLLASTEGVSLERIDAAISTDQTDNWTSAASTAGYGTPTRPNSQTRSAGPPLHYFTLESPTFSPDGDGHRDQLAITYRTAVPGTMARVSVFDVEGLPVAQLERVALLAAEGALNWDGTTDNGRLAPPGAYIILVESFDGEGHTHRYKLLAVLAG